MSSLGSFLFSQADLSANGSAPAAAAAAAAESATQTAAANPNAGMMNIVMIVVMVGAFYLMILRPQQKRTKEHKGFLEELKIGSRVVTTSGFFGKVTALDGNEVKLELGDRVIVRVLKSQVAGLEGNASQVVAAANQR
jgi:preprotein translocase subunit YajC